MAIERGTREASVAVRSEEEEEEEEEEEGEVLEGGARLPPQQQSKHECLSLLLTHSLTHSLGNALKGTLASGQHPKERGSSRDRGEDY